MAGGTTDHAVQMWDFKGQNVVATLPGHEGEITSISFSENGYYLASGSKDGCCKLWDVRKPVNFQTIEVPGKAAVNACSFDLSGQFLAVGSSNLQVFNFESRTKLVETVALKDHTEAIMGVKWAPDARGLYSVSMDRTLTVFGVNQIE